MQGRRECPGWFARARLRTRQRAVCSRARRRRTGPRGSLVGPFLGLPLGHGHGLPVDSRPAVDPADERVLQIPLVVAVGIVVRPRVRAPALLALDAARNHARGEVEQEAELERLREVVVEDVALVLDDDALVAFPEPFDDLPLLSHLLLAAEDTEVLVHRSGQLVADRPGP